MEIFENQLTFRNLCFFSGFKIRDFLGFMHDICDKNSSKEVITRSMVYDTCNKFYRKQLPKFLQKIDSAIIVNYLRQLCNMMKESSNNFYFVSDDFNENFFQVMLYYKILSFVSYSQRGSDGMVDARGFLIDLSTALQFKIISRSKLRSPSLKYLNFTDTYIVYPKVFNVLIFT